MISRDNPLHVDHINRFWDRFSAAMRDKDLAIQAELSRQVFRIPHYGIFRHECINASSVMSHSLIILIVSTYIAGCGEGHSFC